jgi:hypothetical protein
MGRSYSKCGEKEKLIGRFGGTARREETKERYRRR